MSTTSTLTPPQLRGLGYGLYFFLGFGAGSIGSTISGWVSERASLDLAFPVLAALLLPSAAAMIWLGIIHRRNGPVSEAEIGIS